MKKILIGLVILLVLCGCNSNTEYVEPSREEVTATNPALGKKETDIKPILIVEKKEDSLYIGEKDYDFGSVEGYSDNGEVSILFDDSEVDFETPKTYPIKVFAIDNYNVQEDSLELTIEKKITKQESIHSETYMENNGYSYNATPFRRVFYSIQEYYDFIATMDGITEDHRQRILNRLETWDEETWKKACINSWKSMSERYDNW